MSLLVYISGTDTVVVGGATRRRKRERKCLFVGIEEREREREREREWGVRRCRVWWTRKTRNPPIKVALTSTSRSRARFVCPFFLNSRSIWCWVFFFAYLFWIFFGFWAHDWIWSSLIFIFIFVWADGHAEKLIFYFILFFWICLIVKFVPCLRVMAADKLLGDQICAGDLVFKNWNFLIFDRGWKLIFRSCLSFDSSFMFCFLIEVVWICMFIIQHQLTRCFLRWVSLVSRGDKLRIFLGEKLQNSDVVFSEETLLFSSRSKLIDKIVLSLGLSFV